MFKKNKEKFSFTPRRLQIETTKNCTFNCVHCCFHDKNDEKVFLKPDYTIKKIILLQKLYPSLIVSHISGGEPLVSKNFKILWKKIFELGTFKMILSSNFELMDYEYVKFINTFPPALINVSLYGFSDYCYRDLTKRNVFKLVYENIIRVIKEKKHVINVKIPLVKRILDDITDIELFCKENNIHYSYVMNLIPPKQKNAKIEDLLVDRNTLLFYLNKIFLSNITVDKKEEYIKLIKSEKYIKKTKTCTSFSDIYLNPIGKISCCCLDNKFYTSVEANGKQTVFTKFIKQLNLRYKNEFDECFNCPAFVVCDLCIVKIRLYEAVNFDYKNYYCWAYKQLFNEIMAFTSNK